MTIAELYEKILSEFYKLPQAAELMEEQVAVSVSAEPEKTLRPENDPPSTVARPEYLVTATLRGVKGQAYAEAETIAIGAGFSDAEEIMGKEIFAGTLKQALDLKASEVQINPIAIAALNAAMNCLNLAPGVFPEDPAVRETYADALCRYVTEHYGRTHIVLVGYDGYIVKRFMEEGLNFWTLDLDPDHIAQDRFDHVVVNGAKLNRESSFAWGKVFLVTGSSLCNGTIVPYLDSGKPLLFYGITCAGAAVLLNLPWFSPEQN